MRFRFVAVAALLVCLGFSVDNNLEVTGNLEIKQGGAASSNFCASFSGLFCLDFEEADTAATCDGTSPTAEAQQRECDCETTDGTCFGEEPATVPEGTYVLALSQEGAQTADSLVRYENVIDDADSFDTQYARFCLYVGIIDSNQGTEIELLRPYGDSTRWAGSSVSAAVVLENFSGDTTPEIWVRAPHSGTLDGTHVDLNQDQWYEITYVLQESTGNQELVVDGAFDGTIDGSCGAGCSGATGAPSTNKVDGFELNNSYSTLNDEQAYFIDVVRWQSSDFGATEGCSGL